MQFNLYLGGVKIRLKKNNMDIFNSFNQVLYPGSKVIRVKGYQGAKEYSIPRDSEVILLDADPAVNYIYMKKVDNNGAEQTMRYKFEEDPVPEFDHEKFVTKEDFNAKMQEVLDGINSLKQQHSEFNF